jgi:hypothetical protein
VRNPERSVISRTVLLDHSTAVSPAVGRVFVLFHSRPLTILFIRACFLSSTHRRRGQGPCVMLTPKISQSFPSVSPSETFPAQIDPNGQATQGQFLTWGNGNMSARETPPLALYSVDRASYLTQCLTLSYVRYQRLEFQLKNSGDEVGSVRGVLS